MPRTSFSIQRQLPGNGAELILFVIDSPLHRSFLLYCQDFCDKVLPLDRGLYAPLSLDCSSSNAGFDTSQTHVQFSSYLTDTDVDSIVAKPKREASSSSQSNTPTMTSGTDNYSSALLRIHVVDEAKRRSQDFFCAKWLLVSKMKFFAAHLTDDSKPDDVDISVQCDVVIFDWLMKYVHKDTSESQQPSGTGSSGPPILGKGGDLFSVFK